MSLSSLVTVVDSQEGLDSGGYGLVWLDVHLDHESEITYYVSRPVGLRQSDSELLQAAAYDQGADLVITSEESVYLTATFTEGDVTLERCDRLAFVIAMTINQVAGLKETFTFTRASVKVSV